MNGSWGKLGQVLYGQRVRFIWHSLEKCEKQLQKSLAWINIWIMIYLQIHRALLLPPPSFTIIYLLPESLVSNLSSSNCSSLHPQQNLQKQTESLLLWCNPAEAWQSPGITFSPSQLPYATGRAEDRHWSPSWGQDIVACKKNELLKKTNPLPHTWATLRDANLRSFPLTHFLKQISFLEYKFFRFLPHSFISRYFKQSNPPLNDLQRSNPS